MDSVLQCALVFCWLYTFIMSTTFGGTCRPAELDIRLYSLHNKYIRSFVNKSYKSRYQKIHTKQHLVLIFITTGDFQAKIILVLYRQRGNNVLQSEFSFRTTAQNVAYFKKSFPDIVI